jgi:hypothetical protein
MQGSAGAMRPSTHFVTLLQLMPTNLGMLNISANQSSVVLKALQVCSLVNGKTAAKEDSVVGPMYKRRGSGYRALSSGVKIIVKKLQSEGI